MIEMLARFDIVRASLLALTLLSACGDDVSSASDGGQRDGVSPTSDGGNPNPTVSAWLGTNVSGDLPRVDVAYQLNPFDTAASQKDANGYPLPGASGSSSTDIGFVLPSGTYDISYRGTGMLSVTGIGQLGGNWQSVSGEQRNQVLITATPGAFGNFLTLTITNGPGQTVTDIHLLLPGHDYDSPAVFTPEFLRLLAPFRALRFMEWQAINGNAIVDWADRPTASHFGKSPYGEPIEHILELVNETGKDCWIGIPEHASDDFVHQLAQSLAHGLDFARIEAARTQAGFTTPFELIVENSNETWNNGFTAFTTFLAAANANPARYTGTYAGSYGPSWQAQWTDLMKVGQYEADRLVGIATIFRQELGAVGKSDVVAPVLSGWATGAAYSDVGMQFISANYGAPKDYIRYVALAPYFGPDDAQTGTLDALFASAQMNIGAMDATWQDFGRLAAQYQVKIAAYEGGQGLNGTTNQSIKHLAQHDVRMYQAYRDYFAQWKQHFGPALFMHFSLAGDPGIPETIYQYGYWGSIIGVMEDPAACQVNLPMLTGSETISDVVHHCPKYKALAEQVP